MEAPMEFWGVEVKVGQTLEVDPMDEFPGYIHISQVALGEAKKEKAEPVVLYLKVDDQKFVLGSLSRDDIPQLSLDIILDKKSVISHSSKSASVYFCGYKVIAGDDTIMSSDCSDDDDDIALTEQEKPETKKLETKPEAAAKVTKPVVGGPSAKQVKIVDPKKDKEEDESDVDVSSPDEEGYEDELISSDEMDVDSDEESDEDEETPAKKADQGKKKGPIASASKTPVSTKKGKNATPEKTDGKKVPHTATPHPMKKGGKTPNNSGKDKSPNNSGGKFNKSGGSGKPFGRGGKQQNKRK